MVVGDFGLVPVGVAAVGFGGFHSKRMGLSFEGGSSLPKQPQPPPQP